MDEHGASPNKKTHGGGLLYFYYLSVSVTT